jgi:hypothetical protein
MKGQESESNRQQPKLNSLRIQSPLSKTLLIREVVQLPKHPHRIPTFWPHWLTIRDVTYYPPKVMV